MKSFSLKFFLLLLLLVPAAVFAEDARLRELFDARRYFELRDALKTRERDAAVELLFYRGLTANRFNELEKSDELLRQYLKKAGRQAPHAVAAYETLADNYTKRALYGKAADAYRALLDNYRDRLSAQQIKSYENVYGLWHALRGVAPQKVTLTGDTELQGTRDAARLLNVPVEFGARRESFVFDTGANISTIAASSAARLGLKILETQISVGSSTDIDVRSKLAVAPELKLGGATVRNVVFLVLDDKDLYFPQINYQIHGIIGFPVISALGRVSLAKNNRVAVFAASPRREAEPNLCLQGLLPLVEAAHGTRRMTLVFDTGATGTEFYLPFFRANEASVKEGRTPQKVKVGGAGGSREVSVYRLPELAIEVGGRSAKLANTRVLIEETNENSRYFDGNLGQDVIKQFERLTLDFRAMRIGFE